MHLVDPSAHLSRWREHPIEVLILSLGLILLALLLPPVPCGIVVLGVSAAAILVGARIPLGVYLRVMLLPASFLILGLLALVLSVGTHESSRWVEISPQGIEEAGRVLVRSLAAVSSMMLLALAVPLQEVLSLLRRWHVPAVLTELMALVYRLLFVFNETLEAMIRAQGCRLGYRNLRTSYRSLGAAVAALFIRSIDRARRLEMGLAARGYQGELRVMSCRHAVSKPALLGIFLTLSAIVALALAWQGGLPWPI